jgi:hypothetical protein
MLSQIQKLSSLMIVLNVYNVIMYFQKLTGKGETIL